MAPRQSEGGVHDPPIDMNAEVNLKHILLLEDCMTLRDHRLRLCCRLTDSVACIRTVMCGTVIQAETRRETNATFQPFLLHERPGAIFDVLGNLGHGLPWLDELACGLPNLSMNLRRPSDVVVGDLWIFHGHAFVVTFLFGGSSPRVTAGVLGIRFGMG